MRRLYIRPGAIGDCLCWLPVLAAIGASDSEVWAPGAVLPLLGLAPRRRNLASTGFSLLGIPGARRPAELIESLRAFDEILSWSGWNQPDLAATLRALELPVHFFPALPSGSASEHVSDLFLRDTRAWHGLEAEPGGWRSEGGRKFLLGSLDETVARTLPPLIVLHPFSGSVRKNWPLANYRRLADAIDTAWGSQVRIQWCAGPEDPLPPELSRDAWRFENLGDLAQALAAASLYIGNDSGITHLAAILGVPCVVFFGPESPGRWSPRGARVSIVSASHEGEPARDTPYEEGERKVFNSIRKLFD